MIELQCESAPVTSNEEFVQLVHDLAKNRGFTVWRDHAGNWHTYRPDGSEIC